MKNPLDASGVRALRIGLADLGPKPDNGVAPWAWHWDGSTIDGGDWNDDQSLYDMVPSFEQGCDLMLQDVDQYGVHGYTGIAHDIKAKPNAHRRWTGAFTRRAGSGWPSQ